MNMKSKLIWVKLSLIVTLFILIISCIFIKLDFSQLCGFVSKDDQYQIVVDYKTNQYIKKNDVKKIKSEINERNYTFYIYFSSRIDDSFVYWANCTTDSFHLDTGNYNYPIEFGKINFLWYMFKNII